MIQPGCEMDQVKLIMCMATDIYLYVNVRWFLQLQIRAYRFFLKSDTILVEAADLN